MAGDITCRLDVNPVTRVCNRSFLAPIVYKIFHFLQMPFSNSLKGNIFKFKFSFREFVVFEWGHVVAGVFYFFNRWGTGGILIYGRKTKRNGPKKFSCAW